MHVQVISINHGSTPYMDLLLRSLFAHHRDRSRIDVLVLNSGPDHDLDRLDWARRLGTRIRPSGYPLDVPVSTHGEILRDAVLAEPDCDAYLFVDSDVCFTADNTIGAMVEERTADTHLFAVQAAWATVEGTIYDPAGVPNTSTSQIRQAVRFADQEQWTDSAIFPVGYGDRVHPFCTLVRNDQVFRSIVELLGLSPAMTECVRGGLFWDALGLLTQVMRTHGRTWTTSAQSVLHFAGVSWRTDQASRHAAHRDALLERYALAHLR